MEGPTAYLESPSASHLILFHTFTIILSAIKNLHPKRLPRTAENKQISKGSSSEYHLFHAVQTLLITKVKTTEFGRWDPPPTDRRWHVRWNTENRSDDDLGEEETQEETPGPFWSPQHPTLTGGHSPGAF